MIPADPSKLSFETCWRCGNIPTAKRIETKDGRLIPICVLCFLADARANNGIVPDYSDLTPAKLVIPPGIPRHPLPPTSDDLKRADLASPVKKVRVSSRKPIGKG